MKGGWFQCSYSFSAHEKEGGMSGMILLAHNSIGFGGILLILAPYVVKTACVFFAVKNSVCSLRVYDTYCTTSMI